VARHAGASRVEAVLRNTDDEIILEVRDNGKGIEPKKLSGQESLGLLGMRERALLFRGEVFIQGKKGAGTTVSVTMPLSQPPSAGKAKGTPGKKAALKSGEAR
jgi:signal transduction histidine kinase